MDGRAQLSVLSSAVRVRGEKGENETAAPAEAEAQRRERRPVGIAGLSKASVLSRLAGGGEGRGWTMMAEEDDNDDEWTDGEGRRCGRGRSFSCRRGQCGNGKRASRDPGGSGGRQSRASLYCATQKRGRPAALLCMEQG